MELIGLLMSFAALYGYYTGNMTLFFWVGSIVAILNILFMLSRFGCIGTIITLVCWVYAYRHTDGLWDSIILGSCYASFILMAFLCALYIPIIVGAIVAIVLSPFFWLKEKFFGD